MGGGTRTRLANILFSRELDKRYAASGIVSQAMHPGQVDSNFASYGDRHLQEHMASASTVSPVEPAETIVWLATTSEGGHPGGRYFFRKAEEAASAAALDDTAAERLWDESEILLKSLGF